MGDVRNAFIEDEHKSIAAKTSVIAYEVYVDKPNSLKYAFAIFIATLIIVPVAFSSSSDTKENWAPLFLFVLLGFPLVMRLLRRFFTEKMSIELGKDYIHINAEKPTTVYFFDIINYKIWRRNTTSLTLHLRNGNKIKLGISPVFGWQERLENFVFDFSNAIEKYNSRDHIQVERKKPLFAFGFTLVLLLLLASTMVWAVSDMIFDGRKFSMVFWVYVATLSTSISYRFLRRRRN